jgi:hypothetical protein
MKFAGRLMLGLRGICARGNEEERTSTASIQKMEWILAMLSKVLAPSWRMPYGEVSRGKLTLTRSRSLMLTGIRLEGPHTN